MANELIDSLIERTGARKWLEPEARDVNVLAWHFVPLRLEGWTAVRQRVRDLPVPPKGGLDDIARTPARLTDSVWRQEAEEGPAVHLTTFETGSRADARAWLLRSLAEFETLQLERSDVAGEVAYSVPGETSIVFVRGNVVFLVRNAEFKLAKLGNVARTLDAQLQEEPRRFTRTIDIPPPRFRKERATALDIPEPAENRWVRLVVRGGEPRIERGRPVVVPAGGKVAVIVAFESAEGTEGTRIEAEVT
jgi:hypothetical protein